MKFIKRTISTLLILTIIVLLFRGWIYRHSITYKSIELRQKYLATDDKLLKYIETNVDNRSNINIEDLIKLGLSLTSKQLNFTMSKNDNDPNKLITSKTAHCVGYASFFATTCDDLLKRYNLSDNWIVKHHVGHIYLFGTNIHKYFDSPFFKDHDFVTIENRITGKIYAVDPTVYDYLYIDYINYMK